MAAHLFHGMMQNALSGMSVLPRTLAIFEKSMSHSAASLQNFSEIVETVLPMPEQSGHAEDGLGDFSDNSAHGVANEGADAAARTLLALAEAGSGFEKQLQLLNPSVRAVALANEAAASQIHKVSVQSPTQETVAAVPGLAGGGQAFARLSAPFITQGSGHADDVPALLMRDEFVMRKAAVKKYGLPLMYALNNCALPAEESAMSVPAEKVAGFASGGVVSSSKDDEDEDSWSLTVSGGSVSAKSFYNTFSPPDHAAWTDAEAAAYAEELVQSVRDGLGLGSMQEDPQSYLNAILKAFNTDSQSFRIFASGGGTGTDSSVLQEEKTRITDAYAAKIQTAKDLGNVELTELFELQLNTLLNLIDELAYALEQLALSYQESVEETLEEYEEEFDAIQADAGEQLAALQTQYQALSEGSTLISNLGGDADSENELLGQTKSRINAVENSRADAEEEAEALYLARTERLLKSLKTESEYEAQSTAGDGDRELIESTADLQQAYLETLQEIQDLEVERDEQLAELDSEYTTGTISETAEYLSRGGLAGQLSALGELLEKQGLQWGSGLAPAVVRAFAQGGLVYGGTPGKDSVPALLTPGEYVLNTRAVERIGVAALESANAQARNWGQLPELPGYAQGGLVNGADLGRTQQEHLIHFDLGVAQPTVRADNDNLRSLVRGLKQVRKRMVR